MRKIALAFSLSVLVFGQGCTITIPAGLLQPGKIGLQGSPVPVPSVGPLSTPKPGDFPSFGPLTPPSFNPTDPACVAEAKTTLDRYDLDQDGQWSYQEFVAWYAGVLATSNGCPVAGIDDAKNEPPMMANNGGSLVSSGKVKVIAPRSNYAGLDSNGSVAGNAIAMPPALIANNGGIVLSGTISAKMGIAAPAAPMPGPVLISDQGGGSMPIPMPVQHCFPDPKSAFNKIDLDHNGKISLGELCRNPYFPPIIPPRPQPSVVPLPSASPTPGPADCKTGFVQADINHDGYVEFGEFLRTRMPMPIPLPPIATPPMPMGFDDAAGGLVANNSSARLGANSTLVPVAKQLPVDGNLPLYIAIKQQFTSMDVNGDGRLDAAEWCGFATPTPAPTPTPWASPVIYPPIPTPTPAANVCTIIKADANGDGVVTWDEFYSWSQQYGQPTPTKDQAYQQFQALDVNGDGQIDQDEATQWCHPESNPTPTPLPSIPGDLGCGPTFDRFDTNHDGFVSYDEYAEGRYQQLAYFKAPSLSEIAATKAGFRQEAAQFDADGDGQLSLSEFIVACPRGASLPIPTPYPSYGLD